MNQLKNILLKLHGENKTNLRKLYVDKHVFDSGVRSSERFVEDERIYTYHELQFRFVGTGMRHPERMNLLVFLPKRFVTDGEPEREPENGLYAAYEDYLLRKLAPRITELSQELENDRKDSREKAKFEVQTTNECILRRNGMVYDAAGKSFVLRILLHMPLINGTAVNAKSGFKAVRSVLETIEQALMGIDRRQLQRHITTYRHQKELAAWLERNRKTVFVANGSILPRQSDSNAPMPGAVPFAAPKNLEETVKFSDGTEISGMALPEGVTVITGGGYSGKSTLLDALEAGIYHHIPGDGREYVISLPSTSKIYAEDGRIVHDMDMTMFFQQGMAELDFHNFRTAHASGSVSQAANTLEMIYAGSRLLLIDEDTSATNFMIRDRVIRQLVKKEPIIPFVDRVQSLYREAGVSTILVIGGSGEYLQHADLCLMMEDYRLSDVTKLAGRVTQESGLMRNRAACGYTAKSGEKERLPFLQKRYFHQPKSDLQFFISRCVSVDRARYIEIDDYSCDVTRLTAIQSVEQLHTLTYLLERALGMQTDGSCECTQLAEGLTDMLFRPEMLDMVQSDNYQFTLWLEEIRPMDFLAALFRLRGITLTRGR